MNQKKLLSQEKNKIIIFSKNINNSLNNSSNNEKEKNLILRNNKINYRDITMNNDNYLVNREAYNTISKIFGTNFQRKRGIKKKLSNRCFK